MVVRGPRVSIMLVRICHDCLCAGSPQMDEIVQCERRSTQSVGQLRQLTNYSKYLQWLYQSATVANACRSGFAMCL
jgi:hypothetical protein